MAKQTRLLNIVLHDFGTHLTLEVRRSDQAQPEFFNLTTPPHEDNRAAMAKAISHGAAAFLFPEMRQLVEGQLKAIIHGGNYERT